MKKCSPSHGQNDQLVCWWVLVPLFFRPVGVNKPWQDGWMDGRTSCLMHMCVCVYLTVHLPAMPCLYFIFSPPCQSKQTMTRWMDDWTDGQIDDGTDGWNDVSRRPLLCLLCHVCIPFFLRLVRINKPWWDGWMITQMDEMMLHDVLYYM